MPGKILIVDTIATNRIMLKVKLSSAFYDVLQAADVAEALAVAGREVPDLVIAALDLPGGGAAGVACAFAADPRVHLIPILAVGCAADAASRIAALKAGVQDVMTKPVDDALLLSRVRSLIRAYHATSEWRMREDTSQALGLAEESAGFVPAGRCTLVSVDAGHAKASLHRLRPLMSGALNWAKPGEALLETPGGETPETFVLLQPRDPLESAAALRLICTLRANAGTRHAGVLVVQPEPDAVLGAHALDLGADDLMSDGFDAEELAIRVRALQRRKHTDAQLRATFRTGVRAAVQDPLTGLHNRRYAMHHLARIAKHAAQTGGVFAVMVADLDHFKNINDTYGHAAGDAVLQEVAHRLRDALRASDLVARIGGEEFMIVMPGTTPEDARQVAVRICNDISARPFDLPGKADPIAVTVSIGMALSSAARTAPDETIDTAAPMPTNDLGPALLEQADKALYAAKMRGRNCVTLGRPAA